MVYIDGTFYTLRYGGPSRVDERAFNALLDYWASRANVKLKAWHEYGLEDHKGLTMWRFDAETQFEQRDWFVFFYDCALHAYYETQVERGISNVGNSVELQDPQMLQFFLEKVRTVFGPEEDQQAARKQRLYALRQKQKRKRIRYSNTVVSEMPTGDTPCGSANPESQLTCVGDATQPVAADADPDEQPRKRSQSAMLRATIAKAKAQPFAFDISEDTTDLLQDEKASVCAANPAIYTPLLPITEYTPIELKRQRVSARKRLHEAVLDYDFAGVTRIAKEWLASPLNMRRLDFCAVEWALRRVCKKLLPLAHSRQVEARQNAVDMLRHLLTHFVSMKLCHNPLPSQRGPVACIRQHLMHLALAQGDRREIIDFLQLFRCECFSNKD